MRLRDKVAAMFDASGSSCSSDEETNAASCSQNAAEHSQKGQELRAAAESSDLESHMHPQNTAGPSESSALHLLATPAPQKHPQPASHIPMRLSNGRSPFFTSSNLRFHNDVKPREPHALLLMLRKGSLDGLVKRSVELPKNAISLLLAASSLVLPLEKLNWEYVKSLIQQRRYITVLSRAVLDVGSQSPALLLPRDYLSKNVSPPVFQVSPEAARGLCVIHNWLVAFLILALELSTYHCIFQVECLSIIDDSTVPDMALGEHSRHSSKQARAVHFQNDAADGETDPKLEQLLLSRFFCTWRFNSRQQFRMQMVRSLKRWIMFIIEANIAL
jgi:hypothetical protein